MEMNIIKITTIGTTVEWLILLCNIFSYLSFLDVSVSNISETRTYVFFRC